MSIKTKPSNADDEMRSAFNVFDKDGSGTISVDELGQLMKTFGENLSDEDLKVMIQEVDKNGDGHIDCKSRCYHGLDCASHVLGEIQANVLLPTDQEFVNFFLEK